MTDDLNQASVIVDDKERLQPVPLEIRLIIAAIFAVGVLMVFLASLTDVNRSNQEYVQQLCHPDSGKHLDACK